MIEKPAHVFDRDFEWGHLVRFAARVGGPAQLGVVSGRRRQGKTFLLEELARQTGGLYFGATEATGTESRALFAEALAEATRLPTPPRFATWDEAVRYLFSVGAALPGPVVIDEFPYLSAVSPALPSILQRELDRAASAAQRGEPGLSLLLCGSALSVMGRLLAGSAPLRGRANLEVVVHPFDYPLAAQFWGITDPRLAVAQHAVVGGTPAYRRFVNDDVPAGPGDFDDWVLRTVLNPGSPLFREARYLLDEEAGVRDSAMYHSVLAAVAGGSNTRGGIASYVGRKATDISHHLSVLEDCGLLRREEDLFRQGRAVYRIAEPLIVFYQVVMRPRWGFLESGRAAAVWRDARPRFSAQVLGPHFEQLCRDHAAFAPPDLFGELPGEIGAGVVSDPERRTQIQIDVAVLAPPVPGEPRRILSLGEAKWGDIMGSRHVDRLRRARDLLAARGYDTRDTTLTCYSGAGFDPSVTAATADRTAADRIAAITLDQLYGVFRKSSFDQEAATRRPAPMR
ncbi:ATP-binding protein [Frankia sp. CiP3]|uniref:AAA family ATPase n=1 Tax=Frankia sp. CiP3 TaxID=2880971 RepID=UPI001EF65C5B|nr:ATP-binding protein [Frankia sp. CiP3]